MSAVARGLTPAAAVAIVVGCTVVGSSRPTQVSEFGRPLQRPPHSTYPAIDTLDLMTRVYAFSDDSMQGRRAGEPGHDKATAYIARELARIGAIPAGDSGYFQTVTYQDPVTRAERRARNVVAIIRGGDSTLAGSFVVIGAGTDHLGIGTRADAVDHDSVHMFTMATTSLALGGGLRGGAPDTTGRGAGAGGRGGGGGGAGRGAGAGGGRGATGGGRATGTGTGARGATAATDTTGGRGARGGVGGAAATGRGAAGDSSAAAANPTRGRRGGAGGAGDTTAGRGARGGGAAPRVDSRELTPARLDTLRARLDTMRQRRPIRMDSIFNGADENASAAMALLEIAEAIASSGSFVGSTTSIPAVKPRRSILFIWHVGTDAGSAGTNRFVQRPTAGVRLDSIVAAIDVGMIGRGRATEMAEAGVDYLAMVGSRGMSADLSQQVVAVNLLQPKPFRLDYRLDGSTTPREYATMANRGDYSSFARCNIPSAFVTTGVHPDYRRPTDEAQYLDYQHYAAVTHYLSDLVVAIANRPQRLKVDTRSTGC